MRDVDAHRDFGALRKRNYNLMNRALLAVLVKIGVAKLTKPMRFVE